MLLMVPSCLMLVYWVMLLLSIQLVMTAVLGVLYWRTPHSTQPRWLTTVERLLVPVLALFVTMPVDMHWIQLTSPREFAKLMEDGPEVRLYVVRCKIWWNLKVYRNENLGEPIIMWCTKLLSNGTVKLSMSELSFEHSYLVKTQLAHPEQLVQAYRFCILHYIFWWYPFSESR